jgi:hypothetical protein
MTRTEASPKTLLSDEQPLAGYRTVSPLAIVAVILGLASALILTTPLLALLPVAAILTAVAALRGIKLSGGQLAGWWPAVGGLCLATFFLGWGLSSHLARQTVLEQRAREMADVFLGLLQEGKSREAHQFRQPPSTRITSPEAIAEHYAKNPEAAKDLQNFVTQAGVKDLIVRGESARVQFEGVTTATRDGQADMLVLKYSYEPAGKPSGERQPLFVHVNRRFDEATKRPQWEVTGISTTPPPGITAE